METLGDQQSVPPQPLHPAQFSRVYSLSQHHALETLYMDVLGIKSGNLLYAKEVHHWTMGLHKILNQTIGLSPLILGAPTGRLNS